MGVESKKLKSGTCKCGSTWAGKKPNQKKHAEVQRWEPVPYRFPVWTSEVPLPVLCQPSHLDGRLHAPLLRMPVGHTLAALPQTGSGFQCLWCLLEARSSSGRSNTARKRNVKKENSCAVSIKRTEMETTVNSSLSVYCAQIKKKGAHTWCLFSISRPSSMSIGWSSKMEKEQGRKSPSIWTWATRVQQDKTISGTATMSRNNLNMDTVGLDQIYEETGCRVCVRTRVG